MPPTPPVRAEQKRHGNEDRAGETADTELLPVARSRDLGERAADSKTDAPDHHGDHQARGRPVRQQQSRDCSDEERADREAEHARERTARADRL